MVFAVAQDVEQRLGRPLDAAEAQIVEARLGDAELLLRSRIPDLTARVASGALARDAVVMVEADMVLRLVRNPEGYAQESDGNYSYLLRTDVASGRLTVLGAEWTLLGVRSGVYVIRPYLEIP
ncbi:MAG: Gp19/Gp15/Gp42 family protein [Umezawaea sp.]